MLYVSSQICHGRLIIFQPGADTDVWHDVFFVFVWACWRLVPHRSKLKNGNSCSWQQITFGTECWIFLWQDVGKESSLLTGLCIFFGEADGDGGVWACWRLVPHRSKLQIGKSQCKLATNHVWNRMLDFFRGKRLGKSPVFWLGYAFFFGEADGVTLQIICMCFLDSFGPVDGGFLTGPKIKIEKKPFFLRTERSTVPWILYSTRTCTEHAPRISFSNWFYNQDNSDSVTTASIFRLTNSPPVTLSRKHSQWWRSRWTRLRGLVVGRSGMATSEGASSQLHRPVWRTGFCKKKMGIVLVSSR